MNKILVIMGSPRKQGNTHLLCNKFTELLNNSFPPENILVANIGLEKEFHPCYDCKMCINSKCKINDSLKKYISWFNESNYVVWFTPIYFFQLPSQSKCFLDRLYSAKWENKKLYTVIISGSPERYGGSDIIEEIFQRSSEWCGFSYRYSYNKITDDKILPLNQSDLKTFGIIINDIKECMQNENKV